MARKSTAEEAKRKSIMDEINELVLSLGVQTEKIQKHVENVGLDHMKTDDLEYLEISLNKVLDECDGVMPSLISKSHYDR